MAPAEMVFSQESVALVMELLRISRKGNTIWGLGIVMPLPGDRGGEVKEGWEQAWLRKKDGNHK